MRYHGNINQTGIDTVTSWNAKGKFIWMTLDNGLDPISNEDYLRSIWITLGMSGRFASDAFVNAEKDNDDGTKHSSPRWFFEFLDEEKGKDNEGKKMKRIYYYDTRNFGTLRFSLSKSELMQKLDSLGPDILNDCSEELFLETMDETRQTTNICKFLMNQKKISGVGNYLLSEALYRSNIDPFASLSEINNSQRKKLYDEVIETAKASYKKQGMTRPGGSYKDVDGNEGSFAFSLQCYGRDVCPKGRKVIRNTNGPHGRTLWYVEDQLVVPLFKRFSTDDQPVITTQESMIKVSDEKEDQTIPSISELACALTDDSWSSILGQYMKSEAFQMLSKFVSSERERHTVFPPSQDVFAALNMCPFDRVKLVIIGQDPYMRQNQGHGLAFSVQKGMKIPPSLKNIFKELEEDLGIPHPNHGNLEKWADQGVLLLNTVLTVREGQANSHSKMGWEDFTDEIVDKLNQDKSGLVFLLWGLPAARKAKQIDESKHFIIKTSHPSPLGASKTNSPFLGSKCFSRCNEVLTSIGSDEIDWNIE